MAAISSEWVTTRKPHRCLICDGQIAAGERALYHKWKDGGDMYAGHQHEGCTAFFTDCDGDPEEFHFWESLEWQCERDESTIGKRYTGPNDTRAILELEIRPGDGYGDAALRKWPGLAVQIGVMRKQFEEVQNG